MGLESGLKTFCRSVAGAACLSGRDGNGGSGCRLFRVFATGKTLPGAAPDALVPTGLNAYCILFKRIHQIHPGACEIVDIPGNEGEIESQRGGGQKSVNYRKSPRGHEVAPAVND